MNNDFERLKILDQSYVLPFVEADERPLCM